MRLLHPSFVEGTNPMRRLPRPLSFLCRHPFRITLLLAYFATFALPGQAQTGVYATFDTSDFQTPNVGRQYGPTFGLYHDFLHAPLIGIGAEARVNFLGSGDTKVYSGLIGPRLQLRPHVLPVMPYVAGLIGVGHIRINQGFATIDKTRFDYAGVVGLDWTILPRIDWRVVEFSASHLTADVQPRTWSTGLVLRLP